MNLIDIDSTFPLEKVIAFCRHAESDHKMEGAKNMAVDGWETNPSTLLHAIYIAKRFDSPVASYKAIEINGEVVAGGGYSPLIEDGNICVALVRTYTIPAYRSKMFHGRVIIPAQLREAEAHGYRAVLMTFNEYNLWLRYGVKKLHGLAPEGFDGWKELDHQVLIRNTKQYALYKIFDPSYEQRFYETMARIRTD